MGAKNKQTQGWVWLGLVSSRDASCLQANRALEKIAQHIPENCSGFIHPSHNPRATTQTLVMFLYSTLVCHCKDRGSRVRSKQPHVPQG